MSESKNIFIPLNTEYYEAIERGDKHCELRIYGNRWNEKTCYKGRLATISKGYGKAHRLTKEISSFCKLPFENLVKEHQEAMLNCYGEKVKNEQIAIIYFYNEG